MALAIAGGSLCVPLQSMVCLMTNPMVDAPSRKVETHTVLSALSDLSSHANLDASGMAAADPTALKWYAARVSQGAVM